MIRFESKLILFSQIHDFLFIMYCNLKKIIIFVKYTRQIVFITYNGIEFEGLNFRF
jgi:hypothetical protein